MVDEDSGNLKEMSYERKKECYESVKCMSVKEILNYPDLDAVVAEIEERALMKYILMAAEKGINIYMDKPNGIDEDEFDKIINTVEESNTSNWTIVRPVISFSHRCFDIVNENYKIIERIKSGEKIYLPKIAKNLTAGLDWAGNSGKIIARLLLCDKAKKEDYTISSAQNLTWGEVADLYTKLLGAKFEWVSTDEYLEKRPDLKSYPFIFKYDRVFDRKIDNSKVLKATGLKKSDFSSIEDGIKTEIENYERGDK